jgi:hypothetical protein
MCLSKFVSHQSGNHTREDDTDSARRGLSWLTHHGEPPHLLVHHEGMRSMPLSENREAQDPSEPASFESRLAAALRCQLKSVSASRRSRSVCCSHVRDRTSAVFEKTAAGHPDSLGRSHE